MKFLKVAVMAAVALAWSSAYAFHSGGVAECEGCHSMHNSLDGSSNTISGVSNAFLLKGSDQSSTCFDCHQDPKPGSYHISNSTFPNDPVWAYPAAFAGGPVNMTPGGDFDWLKVTTTYTVRNTPATDEGFKRGHSIVAQDFGFAADERLSVAPGGTYPAGNLACSSCHDPHGRYRIDSTGAIKTTGLPIFNSSSYTSSNAPIAGVSAVGVYRILGGAGYQPKSLAGNYAFGYNPPLAVVASTYGRSEAATQTAIAYGSGMSEWCSNCHTGFLQSGYTSGDMGLKHPAGGLSKLTTAVAANYNAYVSSGIMTGTGGGAAFSTLNPFEYGTTTVADTKAAALTPTGASTSNNVACVSCHRVHASGFESMLRFSYINEFMTVANATTNAAEYDGTDGLNGTEGKIHHGFTKAMTQRAYYERPATAFGPYARVRCNKCHAKD